MCPSVSSTCPCPRGVGAAIWLRHRQRGLVQMPVEAELLPGPLRTLRGSARETPTVSSGAEPDAEPGPGQHQNPPSFPSNQPSQVSAELGPAGPPPAEQRLDVGWVGRQASLLG